MQRRSFLKAGIAGSAAALLSRGRALAAGADSHIEVLLDEPLGTIAPTVYGHFIEHLGGVIYDGVWVGEGSKVPNTGGIRTALVDAMRRIHAPVIRWPGGWMRRRDRKSTRLNSSHHTTSRMPSSA